MPKKEPNGGRDASLESRVTRSESESAEQRGDIRFYGTAIQDLRSVVKDFGEQLKLLADRMASSRETQWPTLLGVVALGLTMLGFAVLSIRIEMADKVGTVRAMQDIDHSRIVRLEDFNAQLALEYLKQGHEK